MVGIGIASSLHDDDALWKHNIAVDGCYKGPPVIKSPVIKLTKDGHIYYKQKRFEITYYRDKVGVSLTSNKLIYFESKNDAGLVQIDRFPFLMRFSEDMTTVNIPDENFKYIQFKKFRCLS